MSRPPWVQPVVRRRHRRQLPPLYVLVAMFGIVAIIVSALVQLIWWAVS